jgi:hypothetical protein
MAKKFSKDYWEVYRKVQKNKKQMQTIGLKNEWYNR